MEVLNYELGIIHKRFQISHSHVCTARQSGSSMFSSAYVFHLVHRGIHELHAPALTPHALTLVQHTIQIWMPKTSSH